MHSGELDAVEATLRTRFTALRAARGGAPVYALEHGLSGADLRRLRSTVGPILRLNGIDDSWTHRALPLIVLATEAGYRYRGTGTDFWPVLSSQLGASFTDRDRHGLSMLFETAHRTVGLKQPEATAWNLAFRHIAWPIANAVAPVEIHRSLADVLHRLFRRPPATFEGAEMAVALRSAATATGAPRRLMEWLEEDQLAAAMSRRLLDLPDDGSLDPAVTHRIWSDMESDPLTRRALGSARVEHRQLQAAGRGFGRYGRAYFALQMTGDQPTIFLVPPTLGSADFDRLARQLQGRRARLWNAAQPIDLQSLAEGRAVPLELESLPEPGTAFLAEDVVADLEGSAANLLRSFEPDLQAPLLFPASEGVVAQTGLVRPGATRLWWWITQRRTAKPDGVRHIATAGSAQVLEIDVDQPAARAWLETQGISVERGPILEPVLAPVLERRPRGHDVPFGLPALFRVAGAAKDTTAVLGRTEIDLSEDRPFLLVEDDVAGEHELRLRSAWPDTVCGWRRLGLTPSGAAPISIMPDTTELTLEALLEGELSMQLSAEPGLVTPALILSVVASGAEVARARTETAGSALFGGGSPLLRNLILQLKASERFERGELVAELEGVSRETWPLGRRLRTVRWERGADAWTPMVDGEPVQVVGIPADTPTKRPSPEPATGPALLLPLSADGEVLGSDGLVVGPRSLTFGLSSTSENLDALARAWQAPRDSGLETTASAWVRWSCAETAHVILDLVRARAVQTLERMTVRQLCGRGWADLEDGLIGSSPDFWMALADLAITRGMAAGEGFPGLAIENRTSLQDCLAARFQAVASNLYALTASEIEDLSPQLDEAVNEAWEDHFQALERAGAAFHLEDECDAGNDGAVWAKAVRDAEDRHQLRPLGRKLTPHARGRALMTTQYETCRLPDLVALLEAEHIDLRTRQPHWLAEGDIRRGLMFWTDPRAFHQETEGPETLQRLLADRQTTRAIRYAALRYALARGQLGGVR